MFAHTTSWKPVAQYVHCVKLCEYKSVYDYFQFYIVKENRGNEGTCVGVSRWPVHDFNHRTTADMWLYRAYSGNLYHNGEQTLTLSSYTQGDYITCVLDMEARTVSFGKNGEVWCSPLTNTKIQFHQLSYQKLSFNTH